MAGLFIAGGGPGCSSKRPFTYAFPPPPSACDVPDPPPSLPTDTVVGDGTPGGCTEAALRDAMNQGGNITFDCGGGAVTISVSSEITVSQDAILDGEGLITLDGQGMTRILHTDARVVLTVMGINFVNGNGEAAGGEYGSGGAIRVGWLGILNVFDCTFTDNVAAADTMMVDPGVDPVIQSRFVRWRKRPWPKATPEASTQRSVSFASQWSPADASATSRNAF